MSKDLTRARAAKILAESRKTLAEAKFLHAKAEQLCAADRNRPTEPSPDPYMRDDYPREGCTLTVDVQPNGYALSVTDPRGRIIERYAPARTPAAIGRMVREWCEGRPPALRRPGDNDGAA